MKTCNCTLMFFQQDWTWHLQNLVGCIYYRHLPHPNAPTKWPHLSLQSHQPRSTVEKSDQMPYTAWGQTSTSKYSGKSVWWCVQLRTPVALKAASVIWKQRSCKYHVCIYTHIYIQESWASIIQIQGGASNYSATLPPTLCRAPICINCTQ